MKPELFPNLIQFWVDVWQQICKRLCCGPFWCYHHDRCSNVRCVNFEAQEIFVSDVLEEASYTFCMVSFLFVNLIDLVMGCLFSISFLKS